ncbi:RabGAP/TBC [Myriangium duriaei CBS 260.36]|uniref:RabGAP/TBC n=1 Tax=Myriangium duriaei CBS 260.36 TaxID=1168546 RepID=A0A9P4J0R3_9PEZI|nr:RabGAP/TBC [Myriangium duriaei CBS 260.36]
MEMEAHNDRPPTTDTRPPTPYDFNLLKSLQAKAAAETNTPSIPPAPPLHIPADPKATHLTPDPASRIDRDSVHSTTTKKRDSAVSDVPDSNRRFDYFTSTRPSTAHPLPRQPSRGTLTSLRRSPSLRILTPSPSQRKLRKKNVPERFQWETTAPPVPSLGPRPPSFHGISLDIPNGALEGLREEDGLGFSNRGSVLLGERQLKELERAGIMSLESEPAQAQDKIGANEVRNGEADKQSSANGEEPASPRRLQPGRRKPSIHMLQAALEGGRILSAEEISFSMRLRSMYDHGDENAADWSAPAIPITVRSASSERDDATLQQQDTASSSDEVSSLKVAKKREDVSGTLRGRSSSKRIQSTIRNASETAGGIEDYSNVRGRDVDRYGFIQPSRSNSRASNGSRTSGDRRERPSMQRVSSSLLLISDSPRQKRGSRRGPRSIKARSSRSVPPGMPKDARSLRTMTSQRSFRSTSSSFLEGAGLRTKNQKLLDQASDMLTLPPGLEAIAEQEDTGRTAGAIKRREWSREEKWQKMAILRSTTPPQNGQAQRATGGGMAFFFDPNNPRVVSRTWKGIPDRWRATAWHSFLSSSVKKRGGESDEQLIEQFNRLQEENCADDVQIDVDVPRTINMHVMFRKRYRGGQRLLFRVLHAIALKFPDIGYVQGMASLATTLLCYFDEEMTFVMMVRLWELRGLKTLYCHGFEGLMAALAEFDKEWLGQGEVAQKLEELGISGTAYGTRWYLTLFNMSIPFPAQLRIWDVFMLLGDRDEVESGQSANFEGADMDVLHAASAALIDATRDILLDSDFENAMKTLTSWIPVKDEDLLMRVAKAEWKAKKRRTRKA